MTGYDVFMLPFEKGILGALRKELMGHARGEVLEVGHGTGANFPYLDRAKITGLHLVERKLKGDLTPLVKEAREGTVEALPFEGERFDAVIASLVFCSVQDPRKGLEEIHRVLRPGGVFYFIEHVRPVHPATGKIFDLATPLWKKVAGGCHLNRRTAASIEEVFYRVDFFKDTGVFIGGTAFKKERR